MRTGDLRLLPLRRDLGGLAVLIAFAASAAAQLPAADEPVPSKKYAVQYTRSFRGGEKPPGWDYIGPGAEQCVQFEPGGLHITLPPGWKGSRPSTGAKALFGVKGDFEITLRFEIFKAPNPADVGPGGTRLSLVAFKDTPLKDTPRSEVATINWNPDRKIDNGGLFTTWARLGESAPNRQPLGAFSTAAKTGRFRLIRSGADLYYLFAEGADENFTFRSKFWFGAEDLQRIQIIGSTGGDIAVLDVRVADLSIRADAIPDAPASDVVAAAAQPGVLAPPAGPKAWVLAGLLASLAITLVLAIAVGVWLLVRKRRGDRQDATKSDVSFPCPGCDRALKTQANLAGKKVRCAECGTVAIVPSLQADIG